MSITIQPNDTAGLQLSGDVETVIGLPSRALREGFAVAVSDGTLLRGTFDSKIRECSFVVAVEGSGSISIVRGSGGDTVRLSAQIDWIIVVPGDHALRPAEACEDDLQQEFCFADRERKAA
ncbi:hypothetical protein D2V17_19455 [Aurantiacibacter xanthus]|uniref:Uncharacterized protein n=1 Tax=Aurantiacibacter xanthus TaxID=1784712 RepID=A0A3A1NYM9_9SPHN|nr:hypothetical protein [Aurantiacibacter xanthus]RIV80490.1 hypothetical protein D2V17_19455 [Aurantiacibacter xanthus]